MSRTVLFIDKEAANSRNRDKPNRNSTVKKIEEKTEGGESNERNERPPVGKSRNKFPKKYDPIGHAKTHPMKILTRTSLATIVARRDITLPLARNQGDHGARRPLVELFRKKKTS